MPRLTTGYTQGLLFAMLFMGVLYMLGVKLIAPLSLRNMSEQDRSDRMAKFNSTVLPRALLVLYIVYPGQCPPFSKREHAALSAQQHTASNCRQQQRKRRKQRWRTKQARTRFRRQAAKRRGCSTRSA